MNEPTEIHATHPLWMELRNGLLWHRTSAKEHQQIRADGFVKPNDGRINRWGRPYACQELGGLSLFDFTTQPEARVLGEAVKWRQFLGDAGPVTILLGMERSRLEGRLVPYPDNKEGTNGNVIPWVEVCHCGPIPISAIISYLLVCAVDYSRFRKVTILDDTALSTAEAEYSEAVRIDNEGRTKMFEKVRAINQSLEFKARVAEVKRRVEPTKGRP